MIKSETKTLKQYCKEAKKRLKNGFWQNYQQNLSNELTRAEQQGISKSKVQEYYSQKVASDIKRQSDDEFYSVVKKILDEEGEISGVLGRLTDWEYYKTLPYEEQQRYNLNLSERYLKAVERYKKEKTIGCNA